MHASGQSQIATLNAAIQALSSKTVVAAAKAEGAGCCRCAECRDPGPEG